MMPDDKPKAGASDRAAAQQKADYDARYEGRKTDATPDEVRKAEAAQSKIIERDLRGKMKPRS